MGLSAKEVAKHLSQVMHQQWDVAGKDDAVMSRPMSLNQAKALQAWFHPVLAGSEIGINASRSAPNKHRVFIHISALQAKWNSLFDQPLPSENNVPVPVAPTQQAMKTSEELWREEWKLAESFFDDPKNKGKSKFRKKEPRNGDAYSKHFHKINKYNQNVNRVRHSFVLVNGKIYAIANGEYRVGSGGFGDVKVIHDKSGNRFVIKVKPQLVVPADETDYDLRENEITKRIAFLKGTTTRRIVDSAGNIVVKTYKGKEISSKAYAIFDYKGEEELFEYLKKHARQTHVSIQKGLEIAIECANQVQALHDLQIIHGDLKPENFMVNEKGERHIISAIDFGFSLYLEEGKDTVFEVTAGSEDYMADELSPTKGLVPFSRASDVFALGKIFQYLHIPKALIDRMTKLDPTARITLGAAKAILIDELRDVQNLSANAQELIRAHEAEQNEVLDWLVTKTGIVSRLWNYELSNKEVYVSDPIPLADAIKAVEVFGELAPRICEINSDDEEAEIIIDKEKLRQAMIDERKLKEFQELQEALKPYAQLHGINMTFIAHSDAHTRGMHLSFTVAKENQNMLTAFQQALIKLELPFLYIDNKEPKLPIIIFQDNVLNRAGKHPGAFARMIEAEMALHLPNSNNVPLQHAIDDLGAFILMNTNTDNDDDDSFALGFEVLRELSDYISNGLANIDPNQIRSLFNRMENNIKIESRTGFEKELKAFVQRIPTLKPFEIELFAPAAPMSTPVFLTPAQINARKASARAQLESSLEEHREPLKPHNGQPVSPKKKPPK